MIGDVNHHYYRKELNALLGPDGVAGLYDLFSTGVMWYFARSSAPTTNFLVSIADYMQVHVARTNILGNPDINSQDGQNAKQRRVGAMAWTQVLAGLGGVASFMLETIKSGGDDHDLSTAKKSFLSASSLLASLTMIVTFSEKMLITTTSKGKKVGNEIKGIVLDANNDIRAATEYAVMALYPWVRSIKAIKRTIDLAVPILAFRDGIENFITDGISKVFVNKPNTPFPKKLGNILKYVFFIFDKEEKKGKPFADVSLPKIFAKKWFIGKGHFRDRYLAPLFRLLGCKNVPQINLEGENGNRALVVQCPKEHIPEGYENPQILNFEQETLALVGT